ncbi:hypothetical protein SD457_09325 [Coprobacillaceae bacterium CR2/5/TPMF4]|nr:hypothetical protein SD457_09325 [Coprobacillaceae bacterium CR2/5/TPMF4]
MASGSDAAKNVANLVLLDNNFDAMPHIVDEGRRVINNISMSGFYVFNKNNFFNFIGNNYYYFWADLPFRTSTAFCN